MLRGNSGSGKSTIARAVQQRFPRASCLVVPQDTIRRRMLREFDIPAATNIDLIEHVAAFGLAPDHLPLKTTMNIAKLRDQLIGAG